MKKSQLKQIIKEELLKEVKENWSPLDYFYKQGYSAGQILNPLVDELIKTKGLEGAKKHIGSLVGDEPQYDMSSRTPFREGALSASSEITVKDLKGMTKDELIKFQGFIFGRSDKKRLLKAVEKELVKRDS
tara:strand:- start:4067 stop:4459 length:393 start_codon:yes stop_codon:yes gene_type:complete